MSFFLLLYVSFLQQSVLTTPTTCYLLLLLGLLVSASHCRCPAEVFWALVVMTATTHTRTFHRYYDTHTHKVPGSQEWCVVGVWQAGTSRNVSASTERKTGAANRATKTSEALRACGCKTGGSRIHSQAKWNTSGGICQNKKDEGLLSIPRWDSSTVQKKQAAGTAYYFPLVLSHHEPFSAFHGL